MAPFFLILTETHLTGRFGRDYPPDCVRKITEELCSVRGPPDPPSAKGLLPARRLVARAENAHLKGMKDPTREGAFALLSAVLDRKRPLDEALEALPEMPSRDRAAAHRLAATALRRLGSLDAVLDAHLRRQPPLAVQHILRLGAAGLLFLHTPAHAAVATAVALARALGFPAFTGLVNAVLRRIAQRGPQILEDLDTVRLDTPPWLWRSWGSEAFAIAAAHQAEAPLDLTLAPGAEAPAGSFRLPTGSVRFPPGTSVIDLPGFSAGRFWVQDAAAALPVLLLAPHRGERVADMCAAPGGKTAQLAAAGAIVTAIERNPDRLQRLRANLARLRLSAELVLADAAHYQAPASFDAVLLDAPCSATGTIRRHPDILHRARKQHLKFLAAEQDRLLAASARLLRPGGRLIYAVCSLQPEEGIERVKAALRDLPFRHAPFTPSELPALPQAITKEGLLRTLPAMWPEYGGMDGFFAARLIRL
jgi:16S rRNA (cytosine967-C5)-methyltransferase